MNVMTGHSGVDVYSPDRRDSDAGKNENKGYTYLSMVVNSGSKGKDKGKGSQVVVVSPITDVVIDDSVDHMEARSLHNDFTMSVLGYKLSTIVVTGLDMYGTCIDHSLPRGIPPDKFYSSYNVYKDPDCRIVMTSGSCTYNCVLIDMRRKSTGSYKEVDGIGFFKMTFIGVKLE